MPFTKDGKWIPPEDEFGYRKKQEAAPSPTPSSPAVMTQPFPVSTPSSPTASKPVETERRSFLDRAGDFLRRLGGAAKEAIEYGATGAYKSLGGPYLDRLLRRAVGVPEDSGFSPLAEALSATIRNPLNPAASIQQQTIENLYQPSAIERRLQEGPEGAEYLSPTVARGAEFVGQVLGLLPPTGAAALTGGRLAAQAAGRALAFAPRVVQRLGTSIAAGAGTGATLATAQEALQELAAPQEETLQEHLRDIGSATGEFAAFGAAYPVASRIVDRTIQALPGRAQQALSTAAERFPLAAHMARGAAEGALAGGMVGAGMGVAEAIRQEDPKQLLRSILEQSGQEIAENLVEAVAYGITRRIARTGIPQPVEPIALVPRIREAIRNRLVEPVRQQFDQLWTQLKAMGMSDREADNVLVDTMASFPEGEEVLGEAARDVIQEIESRAASRPVSVPEVTAESIPSSVETQPASTQEMQEQTKTERPRESTTDRIKYRVTKTSVIVEHGGQTYRFPHSNGSVRLPKGYSEAELRDRLGADIGPEMSLDAFLNALDRANQQPAPVFPGDTVEFATADGETVRGKVKGVDFDNMVHVVPEGRVLTTVRVPVDQVTKVSPEVGTQTLRPESIRPEDRTETMTTAAGNGKTAFEQETAQPSVSSEGKAEAQENRQPSARSDQIRYRVLGQNRAIQVQYKGRSAIFNVRKDGTITIPRKLGPAGVQEWLGFEVPPSTTALGFMARLDEANRALMGGQAQPTSAAPESATEQAVSASQVQLETRKEKRETGDREVTGRGVNVEGQQRRPEAGEETRPVRADRRDVLEEHQAADVQVGTAQRNVEEADRFDDRGDVADETNASGTRAAGRARSGQAGPTVGVGADDRTGAGDGGVSRNAPESAGELEGRSGRAGRERRESPERAERRLTASDFVITDELEELGGPKTKVKQNIQALRLLKQIEEEGRPATPEEQKILARYVGWGGLPQVFDAKNKDSDEWGKEYAEVRRLVDEGILTEKEYEQMRTSTLNAHYTSAEVIRAMYDGLRRLGFQGGRVLEPSMGIGHFFGLMPKEMAASSERTGVELDSVSGRIARLLYPKSNVHIMGFEELRVPDNYFDLAIGNVPFGNYGVVDATYKGPLAFVKQRIHNYFFAKALDKVREGGLVVFITSTGTLNAKDGKRFREYLAEKADFLGAIRLPGNAFLKNAGTQVTTDIIVLRKRAKGEQARHADAFIQTVPVTVDGKEFLDNEYFVRHPEMVLGLYREDKLHPGRLGVVSDGRDLEEAIRQAFERLPAGVYQGRETSSEAFEQRLATQEAEYTWKNVDIGSYFVRDGKLLVRTFDGEEVPDLTADQMERVKAMLPLRDLVRYLVRQMQNPDVTDEQVAEIQKELNRLYDGFVAKYGPLNDPKNLELMREDPVGGGLLMSIEEYRKDGQNVTVKKGAIFTQRTIRPVIKKETAETAEEAMILSLYEKGHLDMAYMSKLYGKPESDIIQELKGKIYLNPDGGWETADEYLSGNVRKKLERAREAAEKDPRFEENVKALEAVLPPDIPAHDIHVRLGAPWIPAKDYKDFIRDLLNAPYGHLEVSYNTFAASWKITSHDRQIKNGYSNIYEYGVVSKNKPLLTALELIEMTMNLREAQITKQTTNERGETITVVDKERTAEAKNKQKQIQELFKQWIWADDARRERLVRLYNDQFNSIVPRKYDGSLVYGNEENPRPVPGLSTAFQLRQHQRDAVWRILQGKNTLIAYSVGGGKTLINIVAAMEMRRLGIANKPMVVVPNSIIGQWYADIYRAYPGAKVLWLTSKTLPVVSKKKPANMSKEEWEKKVAQERLARARALSRIATGDYDMILISERMFTRLPVSAKLQNQFIEEQIKAVEKAKEGADSTTVKRLEATKQRLRAKLIQNVEEIDRDVVLPFEELGIDYLFVDEAHLYKNLYYHTKLNNVSGLPRSPSQRAEDMFMKVLWLTRMRNGGGVVFSTGTPITNSIAEMYTLQRYMQYDLLKEMGLDHFDAWVATFGEAVTDYEMTATGQYKLRTRFSSFNNLPELLRMFWQFADVRTAEMMNLPRPAEIERVTISSPLSRAQRAYLEVLVDRAKNMSRTDSQKDNYLKLTVDGRKMALDIRLVDPQVREIEPQSKIIKAADNIARIYHDPELARDKEGNPIERATQIVFLDLGTPKAKEETAKESRESDEVTDVADLVEETLTESEKQEMTTIYGDLKRLLIERGIPEKEIAFIHEAKNAQQREQLFQRVRDGKIRVLIGSTEKMGVGMNVQDRLVALHHIDAPWRPADVEQREGRILRQGNRNKKVWIYSYVTEGSFDAIIWDTLKRKAAFIDQVMNGSLAVRKAEDLGETVLNYAQVAAVASGNPLILEKFRIDRKVDELTALKVAHERNVMEANLKLRTIPDQLALVRQRLERLKKDAALRPDTKGDQFRMTLMGETYTQRQKAQEAFEVLLNELPKQMDYGDRKEIGGFDGGFRLFFVKQKLPESLQIHTPNGEILPFKPGENPVVRAENALRGIDKLIEEAESRIEVLQKDLEAARERANKPFEKQEELDEAIREQERINRELENINFMAETGKTEEAEQSEEELPPQLALPAVSSASKGKQTRDTKSTRISRKKIQELAQHIEETARSLTPKAAEKIADLIAQGLDTAIRRDYTGPGREGVFDLRAQTGQVRSRSFHDWRVVGHELGHAFSQKIGRIGDPAELRAIAEKMYPGKTSRMPVALQMEEGFAEFFRQWVVDPELAQRNAPKTYEMFEEKILEDSSLKDLFAKVRAIVDNDLADNALGRAVAGVIVDHVSDPKGEALRHRVVDALAEEDVDEEYGEMYEIGLMKRQLFEIFDSLIPARAMQKEAEKRGYRGRDLEKVILRAGEYQSRAIGLFEERPRDAEGRFLAKRSLKSIMQEAIDEIEKVTGGQPIRLQSVREFKLWNKRLYRQYRKMGAMDIFSAIAIARRVVERYERGFERLPMTREMAEEILEIAKTRFPNVLPLVDEYSETLSNVLLTMAERAGLITKEDRAVIEKGSKHYIPFIYDDPKALLWGKRAGGRAPGQPVKRFRGKVAPVLNVFQATHMKLAEMAQAVDYKKMLDMLADMAELPGMGQYVQIVDPGKKGIMVSLEQAVDRVKNFLGIEEDLANILPQMGIRFFVPKTIADINPNDPIVMTYRDGKPVFLRLAPDVYRMLKSMQPVQLSGILKFLAQTSRLTRYTGLAQIRYITNAIARDIPTALIQAKNPLRLVLDGAAQSAAVMLGTYMRRHISENEWNARMEREYWFFVQSGGASGAAENLLLSMVRSRYDEGVIRTRAPGWGYALLKNGKRVLVKILELPSDMLRFLEEGPRIAAFRTTIIHEFEKLGYNGREMYNKLVDEGTDALPDELQARMEDILLEAVYQAGEITVNFRRRGASEAARKWIPTVPFLHGTIQGTRRTVEQIRKYPVRTAAGILVLVSLSVLQYVIMAQDEDDWKTFQNMNSIARDRYWWLPNPFLPGTYVAIAKPYDYAILANYAERFLDHVVGKEPTSRDIHEDMGSLFATLTQTEVMNTFISSLIDLYANRHDLGGPIVPMSEQDLLPRLQYGPETSITARKIAELYAQIIGDEKGISPRQVEYFVRQNFGKWGTWGLTSTDVIIGLMQTGSWEDAKKNLKPKSGAEYAPVIGDLLYGPAEGASRMTDRFYKDYERAQTIYASLQLLAKEGRKEEIDKFATIENIRLLRALPAMRVIADGLSEMRKEYNKVIGNPDTSAEARRRLMYQKDFFQDFLAGLLYGYRPASPHPAAELTDAEIERVMAYYMEKAQKALINEEKREGGVSDIVQYLMKRMAEKK